MVTQNLDAIVLWLREAVKDASRRFAVAAQSLTASLNHALCFQAWQLIRAGQGQKRSAAERPLTRLNEQRQLKQGFA
jgi:hypothetical protein